MLTDSRELLLSLSTWSWGKMKSVFDTALVWPFMCPGMAVSSGLILVHSEKTLQWPGLFRAEGRGRLKLSAPEAGGSVPDSSLCLSLLEFVLVKFTPPWLALLA